jgi:hypothetical protein
MGVGTRAAPGSVRRCRSGWRHVQRRREQRGRSTCRQPLSLATTPAVPIRIAGWSRSFAFLWGSVWRVVGTQPKTTPPFYSSWGLLVEAAPGCERPRRPTIEASVFVTTSVLLAAVARIETDRGGRSPRSPGIEAWCAHGSPTSRCSPHARSSSSRIECRAAAASFGSSPAGDGPSGSVRPGANGLSGHSTQYSDAPPPMTCASCAASVGSSGRRRSSIRSASGRWPMSTYVSPRYSMACGKSGRRRSASW